jgi:hypothetical protein
MKEKVMTNLMQASNQWRSRPDDERFCSLNELLAKVEHDRQISRSKVMANRDVRALPAGGVGAVEDPEHKGLVLVTRDEPSTAIAPTHWAFGQLAQRAGAPASYLRTLPSELAADCVNYGLQMRDVEDVGMLVRQNGIAEAAAVTGPGYGRIWNRDVVKALIARFGDGVTGDFKVPGEFGVDVPVTKSNTTIYGSDRDIWVFLADEKHRIELPNRRAGKFGSFARGFFLWNSEVGSATFGLGTFLFDYTCCNRIVWGAEEYKEVRIRHTSGAPHRYLEEVAPALEAYALSSAAPLQAKLLAAQKTKVAKLDDFLSSRFTKGQLVGVKAAFQADELRPMATLWDVATGVTAYARGIVHQDERVKLERAAGQIIELAK